ncbi:MAG: 3-isopropylmalate dehydratase small subunit [Chloroflexota bacterium]|nr:3-isopropylmalate dehydratase small subunit [Chloroflexota bacterium]
MSTELNGWAWTFGPSIDTDVIIPAHYLTANTMEELGKHALEGVDPTFSSKVRKGDIIVAKANFGCGSSREHAPMALMGAGVSCVIAENFARIFFRNAINIGLPVLESAEAAEKVQPGDEIHVDLETGAIFNVTRGEQYQAAAYPPAIMEIIKAGGLINSIRNKIAAESARQAATAGATA